MICRLFTFTPNPHMHMKNGVFGTVFHIYECNSAISDPITLVSDIVEFEKVSAFIWAFIRNNRKNFFFKKIIISWGPSQTIKSKQWNLNSSSEFKTFVYALLIFKFYRICTEDSSHGCPPFRPPLTEGCTLLFSSPTLAHSPPLPRRTPSLQSPERTRTISNLCEAYLW